MQNGRLDKIISGILESSSDDLCIFRGVEGHKNFVVGDHKGALKKYNYNSG